jgi:hypothetical protein
MEPSKKTTILFPPALHEKLLRISIESGVNLGELVRTACERQYLSPSPEARLQAVERLTSLRLPAGDPRRMKLQSLPRPERLLP